MATHYEIAANDAKKAASDQVYELHLFDLPDRSGDGTEQYAAVRPTEDLLLTLSQDVYLLEESPQESIDILNRVLLNVFNQADLREALIESGDYADDDDTGDGELSLEGLTLARSGSRLKARQASRRDPLGIETIAQIAIDVVQRWSGKDTGKPRDFLPPSRTTGTASRRTSSSKARTRSASSKRSGSPGS